MCDFKPGDEMIAIDSGGGDVAETGLPDLIVGKIYTCTEVFETDECLECGSSIGVSVAHTIDGYCPCSFRPLAKRSDTLTIESFLTIKPGFEEPKRRVVEPVKEGVA